MKLRLRCLESKQTTRIDLPDPCSVNHLKIVVSQLLSTISSSDSLPTVYFSLNKKDELQSQSPQDSLLDLHVASGDLLFYTLNPLAFCPKISTDLLAENPREKNPSEIDDQVREKNVHDCESEKVSPYFKPQSMELDGHTGSGDGNSSKIDVESGKTDYNCTDSMHEALKYDLQSADVDGDYDSPWKWFSVPFFLRGVLMKETNKYDDHMLMVIAVHAVFQESGFVGYDPASLTMLQGLPLLENYMCNTLSYTLPEIPTSNVVETVRVKFQKLGRFVNIYGSLGTNSSRLCKICLDEHIFAPIFNSVRNYCIPENGYNSPTMNSVPLQEEKLFEFWRIVKDGLTLPLLIDISERTGFEPPPCLIRLPSELKLKILELLHGIDIAKMELVCSEFRYLSMDNDLWKQKFLEEFGNTVNGGKCVRWKWKYASYFKNTKYARSTSPLTFPFSWRVGPRPPMVPVLWGGDYDRFPSMGFPGSLRSPGVDTYSPPLLPHFPPFCQSNGRRNIIPPCFHSTFDT